MKDPLDDPVLQRLAAANPVHVVPLTPEESARSEAALHRIVTTPLQDRRRRPASMLRRWATVVAALLTSVAVALVATTPASAEQVLLQAAENAAKQPPPSGEYLYVRSQAEDPYSFPYEREIWSSRDDAVLRDEGGVSFMAFSDGKDTFDPSLARVMDLNEDGETSTFGNGESITWDELAELPTEPRALERRLSEGLAPSGHGDEWDLWKQVVGLLLESPASPDLRRALWQVLAAAPGTELLGAMTDSAGRPATGIEADFTQEVGEREVLLLDPSDGTLLESRTYADGTLAHRMTVLESGYRDVAPDVEPYHCGPGAVPYVSC
ncbi:CU044_5270 family protein [Oerskovia enterophila]|uniref:CU044_5270 family protein n=1 Tax=Oerskovia enterophila TaxID=43678 RepID=UPI0038061B61